MKTPPKIVFFGTDAFASEILAFLLENKLPIVAVVTREDKPQGRLQKIKEPPVKECCQKMGFKGVLYQPQKASSEEFSSLLKEHQPDLFVVVSYGQILRQNVLDLPSIGTINVHPSLLPKYRGPSPIQSVVLQGETKTGVTIMEMSLAMDAGGIIRMEEVAIPGGMTFGELEALLCDCSKKMLLEEIEKILQRGKIISIPQDETLATYTKKIHAEDSLISWDRSAKEICDFVRGMNPTPGARVTLHCEGKPLLMKIFSVKLLPYQGGKTGEILHCDREHGLVVACLDGAIALLEVQLEGKKRMFIKDFINGFAGRVPHLAF